MPQLTLRMDSTPPSSLRRAAPKLWLTLAALVLCPAVLAWRAPAHADAARNTLSVSSLDDVLESTRTDRWVADFGLDRSLEGQLGYKLGGVRRDLMMPIFRVVSQQFSPGALATRFRQLVAARAASHTLDKVAAFYKSALGKRYARVDQQVRVDDARAFLAAHPVSAARRRLLERWVEASYAMQRYVTVVVTPATLLQRGMHRFDAREPKPDEKALLAPMRSDELRASVVDHAARALADFSDAELAQLAHFEESHAGRDYRAVELDAVRQLLEEGFASLSLELEAAGRRMPRATAHAQRGFGTTRIVSRAH